MKKLDFNQDDLTPAEACNSKDALAVRELLSRVADKWSVLLIVSLDKAPHRKARFSELEKSIPGISQRMLMVTLRNLERDGLLTRQIYPRANA